jgi:pilus assembly protein FimV
MLAWPLLVAAETTTSPEKLQVSQAVTLDPDDPLHVWFKQQDKLLDEILIRLSRIEAIVRDLHRLISGLPDPAKPVAAAPIHPVPATPATPPPAIATAAAPGIMDWTIPAAGGALMILLLLDWRRRRHGESVAPATEMAETVIAPPPEKPANKPVPASQPLATPVAAKQPDPPAELATPAAPATPNGKDQAIELAEIMLSMGLGHGAAQTLIEQISREPKQALAQWLKLLEIYRQNGQQAEFERSAEELRQHFNVQPADWHARPGAQHSLEDYPHIAARIVELWGKPACLTYLQNLLDDNRGGARAGFPQPVAEEFLLLTELLKAGR